MSQNDYSIADQDGQSFLNDLNDALQADQTNNAGTSAPSTTYPNQWWVDDTNNLLKIRNKANSAWVTVAEWDGSSWVPYRNGSALGTAATQNTGTTIGDLAEYEDDGSGNPVINHPNMPEVGGTPVVESGSNSDGYWVRYSDGTQITTQPVDGSLQADATARVEGTIYRSSLNNNDQASWTFPQSFSSHPTVTASEDIFDAFAYIDGAGLSSVDILLISLNGSVTNFNVGAIAIGTWT